jgi:hypothetical protein
LQAIKPGCVKSSSFSPFPFFGPGSRSSIPAAVVLLRHRRPHVEKAGEMAHLLDPFSSPLSSCFSLSSRCRPPLPADLRRRCLSGEPSQRRRLHLVRVDEGRRTHTRALAGRPPIVRAHPCLPR